MVTQFSSNVLQVLSSVAVKSSHLAFLHELDSHLHGLLFILTLSQIDLVNNYPQLVLETQIEFHPQEFVPSQVIYFTVS